MKDFVCFFKLNKYVFLSFVVFLLFLFLYIVYSPKFYRLQEKFIIVISKLNLKDYRLDFPIWENPDFYISLLDSKTFQKYLESKGIELRKDDSFYVYNRKKKKVFDTDIYIATLISNNRYQAYKLLDLYLDEAERFLNKKYHEMIKKYAFYIQKLFEKEIKNIDLIQNKLLDLLKENTSLKIYLEEYFTLVDKKFYLNYEIFKLSLTQSKTSPHVLKLKKQLNALEKRIFDIKKYIFENISVQELYKSYTSIYEQSFETYQKLYNLFYFLNIQSEKKLIFIQRLGYLYVPIKPEKPQLRFSIIFLTLLFTNIAIINYILSKKIRC